MKNFAFHPTYIYNMDGAVISMVQDSGKIITSRDQKWVASVTSWEKVIWLTLGILWFLIYYDDKLF